jgi:hypothetical protein
MTKSTTLAAPANGVGEELVVLPGPRADQVQPISLEPAKAPQDAKSGKEDYVNRRSTGLREGLMAIDWAGSITMLGFLLMMLLGLNFGGVEFAWDSSTVFCLIVFGGVMSAVFVFCEKRLARYPPHTARDFHQQVEPCCSLHPLFSNFALFSIEYYLPFFFQSAKVASPTTSGVLLLPSALTTVSLWVLRRFIH